MNVKAMDVPDVPDPAVLCCGWLVELEGVGASVEVDGVGIDGIVGCALESSDALGQR